MDIQKIAEVLTEANEHYANGRHSYAHDVIKDADLTGDFLSLAGVMIQMINAGIVQVDADTEQEEETDGEG